MNGSHQDSFPELVAQITRVLAERNRVFVAVSGFGGSGKSHLADRLRDHFDIQDDQIIRLDHLYSEHSDGPGILDQVDWPLLMHILKEAHEGKKLHYVGRGFRSESLPCDVELPSVVIVEGIRLLHFDISIWIDCPQQIAMQRAKARDRAQGEDEKTIQRWDTDWGPKDREYFETYHPDQLATFVFPSCI